MNKILVIVGPTATGKTSLGIYLSKKYGGEIVSADSRQVYKYMDIGTGKEWDDTIKIWGYDLIDPKEKYSVSDYFKSMKLVISHIWSRNKLPIIVGGTGLYVKSLIDGIATVDIPKNENLRISLESLKKQELFEKLAVLDSSKAALLNSSDKKNPRRLIRAIEVATWMIENETSKVEVEKRKNVLDKNVSVLQIGLFAENSEMQNRIGKRVEKRIEEGFIDEVEDLLKMGVSWKHQSMNSIGYKDSEKFFKKGETYEDFVNNWVGNEMKYIKRQLTWFKKDKRIEWFNISDLGYPKNVEKKVNKWYSIKRNAKKD